MYEESYGEEDEGSSFERERAARKESTDLIRKQFELRRNTQVKKKLLPALSPTKKSILFHLL